MLMMMSSHLSYNFEDVGIAGVGDDHNGDSVHLTAGGAYIKQVVSNLLSCFPKRLTEFDVVSVEVVNLRLGEHGVVLKLCSSDGGAVVSN